MKSSIQHPTSNNQQPKTLRVLVLNWRDPKHPLAGGAEISLAYHVKYWQQMGYHVTWFSSSYKNAKKEEVYDGIKIIRAGSHYTVSLNFFKQWMSGKFRDTDIIIDCFHFLPFLTPLYIKEKLIIGLINEVAGNVWFDNLFFPLAFIGFKIEPYVIRLYSKNNFITGSKSAAEDLVGVGIYKKKITVINHGFTPLNVTKSFKREENKTILFLGRLAKDKGIEDALLMLELLIRDDKNIKLWVVGKFESKNYEKRLKRLINEFKVKKNCTFFGYVDEATKAELLQRAWIMAHPSAREGWGLNVIEANSVGTPVVGYDVQGLRDSIINGKTGILVDPDAISLADGVEKLLEDKKMLQRLSTRARKWSKTFSWEKSGKQSYEFITMCFETFNKRPKSI